jgi:hypothetical protein
VCHLSESFLILYLLTFTSFNTVACLSMTFLPHFPQTFPSLSQDLLFFQLFVSKNPPLAKKRGVGKGGVTKGRKM